MTLPRSLTINGFKLDVASGYMESDKTRTHLGPRAVDVLVFIAGKSGELVSREDILTAVWSGQIVTDVQVAKAINELRTAFEDTFKPHQFIETLPKRGYRFIANVKFIYADESSNTNVQKTIQTSSESGLIDAGRLSLAPFNQAQEHSGATPSLAVLPFENLSNEQDIDFFSAGVHEDILLHISKLSGIKVLSRNSVMKYDDKGKFSIPEVALNLNVTRILEGSVRRQGNQIRITVQLIDAIQDTLIWSENYDRQLDDIFAVQSDVAKQVAQQLQLNLDSKALSKLDSKPTGNLLAYDLYLKARREDILSATGTARSINLLEQAIEQDAEFTLAYAELAHRLFYSAVVEEEWQTVRQRAYIVARRALDLDPLSSEAHSAMARVLFTDHNYQEAEIEAKLALSLNPNSADGFYMLGKIQRCLNRIGEARECYQRVMELDPQNVDVIGSLAMLYINDDSKSETGFTLLKRALNLTPTSFRLLSKASEFSLAQGNINLAYDYALSAITSDPDNLVGIYRYYRIVANSGHLDLGHAWLNRAREIAPNHDYVYSLSVEELSLEYFFRETMTLSEFVDKANSILNAWIGHNPDNPNIIIYYGNNRVRNARLARENGDSALAADFLQQAGIIYEKALETLRRPDGSYTYSLTSNWLIVSYAGILKVTDRMPTAELILKRLLIDVEDSQHYWSPLEKSMVFAILDQPDVAIAALDYSYKHGLHRAWLLHDRHEFDALRDNEKFQRVIDGINARNRDAYEYINKQIAGEPWTGLPR